MNWSDQIWLAIIASSVIGALLLILSLYAPSLL